MLVVRVVMLSVACVARLTVNVKVCVVDPVALVAVTVYEVALATVVGVPVSAPVDVLKLIPAGVALIAKLAIAPPVELILNPVAAVLTVLVSDDDESVKAGKDKEAQIAQVSHFTSNLSDENNAVLS